MTVDVATKYDDLKKRISNISGRIETAVSPPSLAVMQPIVDTLKVISAEPTMPGLVNNAHVAVTSGVIASSFQYIIGSVSDAKISSEIVDEAKSVVEEAEKLRENSEENTTPDDVGDEVADYILAASSSQIISAEIVEIGRELNGHGDVEKVNMITESIYAKAPELERPAGKAQSIASKFKNAIEKFKTALEMKSKDLAGKIVGEVKATLTSLLKKAADLLQEFFSRLIGAFFGFASWVQGVAKNKKFSMTELTLELPSLEFNILMVGSCPLPLPKLATPKLAAKFIPQPCDQEYQRGYNDAQNDYRAGNPFDANSHEKFPINNYKAGYSQGYIDARNGLYNC
jgi:hypothetical protein